MAAESDDGLRVGVYDHLLTRRLLDRLTSSRGLEPDLIKVETAEAPARLARHLARVVRQALANTEDEAARLRLVEELVALLGDHDEAPAPPARLLRAVQPAKPGPGARTVTLPVLGVGQSDLLVNARGEPNLLHSLISEISSANRIDLIVAFIKRSGLVPLLEPLAAAAANGTTIRVLTTTYLGGTDQRALNDLVDLGAQVRVSYDTSMTRLHAKGWLFERDTGFHTAYIGSSNISQAAMRHGQEWNVRLASAQTPELVDKFRAAFASYWDDPAHGFEPYDPRRDSAAEARFAQAILQAQGGASSDHGEALSPFAIKPYPHQQIMLEDLDREREVYRRHRNLVVAATGTGKTAVAAFDYQRFARARANDRTTQGGQLPTLLFVAHRAEILAQSRRMFRHVLRSGAFGELLTGNDKPEQWRHVFANVQSLSADRVRAMPPDSFDMVIVDEFHHAAAPSYRAVLEHLQPTLLLGLTATPERMDGEDVTHWFDGHVASELRLWDALEQKLLSPFHYYGVGHESLDFRKAGWSGGRYPSAGLNNVLTGDDVIMSWVVQQLHDKVTDPRTMRALAFASTVEHARFVAERLNQHGITAVALDGTSPGAVRRQALDDLRAGTLNVIVTVDLFNEGIDVPAVDTLLLMRPTESVTVFLQQLGRGLRNDDGKEVLTVLDFIGFQHQKFRFDLRFRALTGVGRRELVKAVESGFPYLPAGSYIALDAVAQAAVLENVRAHVPSTTKALVDDVRRHAADRGLSEYRLAEYLHEAIAELADVYQRSNWTSVSRAAGLITAPTPPGRDDEEAALLKRVRALAHVDDVPRLEAYTRLVQGGPQDGSSPLTERFATMLFFTLWPDRRALSPFEGIEELSRFPAVIEELLQAWEVAREGIAHVTHPLAGALAGRTPLRVHARYSREEMLAGLGWASCGAQPRVPKGHAQGTREVADLSADVFDITWRKTEKAYSPTTMYQDYAISPQEIHWESPNSLAYDAPTTRRYVEHEQRGRSVLLFAREAKAGPLGTQPLMFLGPATYVSHEGSRPVSFRWRLDRPMPTAFFESARVVAS